MGMTMPGWYDIAHLGQDVCSPPTIPYEMYTDLDTKDGL